MSGTRPEQDVPAQGVVSLHRVATPSAVSWRTRLGPEAVAGGLIGVLVLAAAIIAGPSLLGFAPFSADPAQGQGPSADVNLGASGAPSAPATVGAATSPPWSAQARTLLTADERLVGLRDQLAQEVAARSPDANQLARTIRSINAALGAAIDAVDAAGRDGLPTGIVARSRVLHADALAVGTAVLDASVTNTRAYVAGGQALTTALAGLEASMAEVASASRLPSPQGTTP